MENGVVTVLYFFTLFYGKQEGNPSSHFMTFGTPSFAFPKQIKQLVFFGKVMLHSKSGKGFKTRKKRRLT